MQQLVKENQIDFYPTNHLEVLRHIRRNIAKIHEEVCKIPYWYQWPSDKPSLSGHCQFLNGLWTICPIYVSRVSAMKCPIPNHILAQLFPVTQKLICQIPSVQFAGFSRLHPHSILDLHTHENPNSDIMHIGVIIPPGKTSGLKVGDHVHLWHAPGDIIIFNDNRPHEAWNHSDQDRVVIYISLVNFHNN